MRAGDPELRSLHLLRHPLPGPHGGAQLSAPAAPVRAVLIGIGNLMRGDDGIGEEVARLVAERGLEDVRVTTVREPVELLVEEPSEGLVVVVDAMRSGRPPGSLTVREVDDRPLRVGSDAGGSHAFGVAAVVELARALGRLPRRLVLVGVEADRFDTGSGLSPAVRAAAPEAAEAVVGLLTQHRLRTRSDQ